jgi:hypothetical protein
MIKNSYRSSCKALLFLSDFNKTLIFSTDSPEGAEIFHADRQMDKHDEINSRCESTYNYTRFEGC